MNCYSCLLQLFDFQNLELPVEGITVLGLASIMALGLPSYELTACDIKPQPFRQELAGLGRQLKVKSYQ
jgi:hypothetical protein